MRADPRLQQLVLLAAAFAVWSGSLGGPFQFDDWNVIVDQPAVHTLHAWWASMPGIRPLLKLSYAINWQTGGGALGFHLTNLLLHGANVLLVFALVRRWPGLPAASARSVAFWAALVFALHPVQAESVLYVSGRSMSLMATFWLAAMLCWLKADDEQTPSSLRWRAASLALFVFALGVRETALGLPLALWCWQRAAGVPWRTGLRRLWPLWTVVLLAIAALAALPGYRRLIGFSLELRSPLDNLALQVDGLAYLLTRPLLLLETNIDPDPALHAAGGLGWSLTAAMLLAGIAAGFLLLRRHALWGLAVLWPFVLLLPTNSLLPRLDLVADRHLYLALLGPAVALAAALAGSLRSRWRFAPLLFVTGALAAASLIRSAEFASETALWTATAARSPDKARVWNNLGYAKLVEGDPAGAVGAFRRALALDPAHPKARINLERAQTEAARESERRR